MTSAEGGPALRIGRLQGLSQAGSVGEVNASAARRARRTSLGKLRWTTFRPATAWIGTEPDAAAVDTRLSMSPAPGSGVLQHVQIIAAGAVEAIAHRHQV